MLLNVGNQPVRTMDSVHLDGKITQKPKKMIICRKSIPFRMCRGPRLRELTYHVIHPQQQSQKFDSKLDSSCHSQPEKQRDVNSKPV